MRRSSGVVPASFAFVLAVLLSNPTRADVPQSGFAPNLAAIGIRDIQNQLRAHGYDPGPDSGVMNDTTRAAILAYQHDYGLREDGIAGPALQNMLHFLRRPPPQPVVSADDSVPPPAPLATLLQPPPPQYEAPSVPPPQAPTFVYGTPQAAPPPPIRSAAPSTAATQAPTALYLPSVPPPPVAMPADRDAEVSPPAALAALLRPPSLPPIPPMGDMASLAPPPPSEPDVPLLDPLAVVAIAVPPVHAVTVTHSAYPDPLAAIAIEIPAAAPRQKDEEPLPALALAPPIRMPAKAVVSPSGDPLPVAVPRIPVASGPLGKDPARPLPAPAFVPPPFSTAPTDAPELAGDLYVRQVQEYLKQLGYFGGEPNGVLDWATVQALVKFDASGTGPSSVIADPKHLDEVWIARLKTALAAKAPPPEAAAHP